MAHNLRIAAVFDEIADMLDLLGENRFRVNAYRNAARSLRDLRSDLAQVARDGALTDIPYVGAHLAEHIQEYLKTGAINRHEQLKAQVPPALIELLRIPGMGPKKVVAVWKQLGVQSMDDLKRALHSGDVAKLAGMGEKTAERIRHGLEFVARSAQRVELGVARPLAAELMEQLRRFEGVERVDAAGSLRRGKETIGDIDLLCVARDGQAVVEQFIKLPRVERVLAAGQTKGSVVVRTPTRRDLQVDIRVVPAESYGAALMYFTGSKDHNIRLREIAIKKGFKLSEYGLFRDDAPVAGRTEEEVYRKLELPWFPPEIREDAGEFDAAGHLPDLVERDDIRGDLHCHTTASDGTATVEQMAQAAIRLGYEYLAIADHSKSQVVAGGLSVDQMWKHIEAIRAANRKNESVELLVSAEVDILGGGQLDYPDDLLAACDLVMASLHSGFGQDRATATKRVLAAIENPYVSCIGHPTGRLIGKREPIDLDMAEVVKAAAVTNTALEVNAHWARLDLKDAHVRMAVDAGVKLMINTDAHSTDELELMEYGIITARRGWATAKDVANTWKLAQLQKWLAKKRGAGEKVPANARAGGHSGERPGHG